MRLDNAPQMPARQHMRILDEHFQELPGSSESDILSMDLWERALLGPAREFLGRPGKRLRARLVELSWSLTNEDQRAMPFELPWLIELVHAGSLIIDDIQDGSVERRGSPCLHQIYGIPLAINTGSWMYVLPLVLINRLNLSPTTVLALHRELSRTLLLCHQGQALDLTIRVDQLSQEEIAKVVGVTTRLKTGSLMALAASLGAIATAAPQAQIDALSSFGCQLGVGLQMADDLGGLLSPRRWAKGQEDLRLGRLTWPWAWLAQELDQLQFAEILEQERRVVSGDDPCALTERLASLLGKSARGRVRAHLAGALRRIEEALGRAAMEPLAREVEHLERSYG